jgi:hypothetical protein
MKRLYTDGIEDIRLFAEEARRAERIIDDVSSSINDLRMFAEELEGNLKLSKTIHRYNMFSDETNELFEALIDFASKHVDRYPEATWAERLKAATQKL